MDKLVEREPATRNSLVAAPALAVQFFLIPLAVVGITVTVYVVVVVREAVGLATVALLNPVAGLQL